MHLERPLELIRFGISGSVEPSFEGYRYTDVITDDFLTASFVNNLKKNQNSPVHKSSSSIVLKLNCKLRYQTHEH